MGGHFKAIEPGRGFVLAFIGSHAKSHVDEVTFQLDPDNYGTNVTVRHSGLAGRPDRYADYQQGWTLILSWLAQQY